eukprot:gene32343-37243_t
MRFYFELKIRTICIKYSHKERTQQVLKEYKGIDIQHLDQDRLQEFQEIEPDHLPKPDWWEEIDQINADRQRKGLPPAI